MKKEQYKFIQQNGITKINSNLSIRQVPTTKNNVPIYDIQNNPSECQNILNYIGWIENGEKIRGNSKWYQEANGYYFWSGNVIDFTEQKRKKLNEDNNIPDFVRGQANAGSSSNTKKVRKIIDYEFRYETPFEKTDLQCTEYVQFKVLQELGHKINWGKHKSGRHGGKWWSILKKLGYIVIESPKENCIVSFTRVYRKNGTLTKEGHVAFVKSVDPNGTIHVFEANWPSQGQFSKRSILKQRWQDYYEAKFIEI